MSFVFKSGFPGLLVSAEPRKMRATAQKLGRVLRHILCCAFAGEFRAHPSSRPHLLTLAVEVCRRPWSGLAVAGEPTALHNHLLRCLSNLHAAVGPRNLAHKLTRSAAARLVSNNTHLHTLYTHTHTFSLCVCCFVV